MAKRQIHVRNYTKHDGTRVTEHERKIDAVPEREKFEKPDWAQLSQTEREFELTKEQEDNRYKEDKIMKLYNKNYTIGEISKKLGMMPNYVQEIILKRK